MPGLDIVVRDYNFEREPLSYDAPVTAGLLGWYFPAGTADRATRNWAESADAKGPASLVGPPVIRDYYSELKGNARFLELPFNLGTTGTLVTVCRSTDDNLAPATRPVFVGHALPVQGFTFYYDGSSLTRLAVQETDGSTVTPVTTSLAGNGNVWRMLIADFSSTDQNIYSMTQGTSATTPATGGKTRVTATSNLRIGSASSSSAYQGMSDCAMAAFYNRQLTAMERDLIYQRVKGYLGRRGITI